MIRQLPPECLHLGFQRGHMGLLTLVNGFHAGLQLAVGRFFLVQRVTQAGNLRLKLLTGDSPRRLCGDGLGTLFSHRNSPPDPLKRCCNPGFEIGNLAHCRPLILCSIGPLASF